MKRKIIDIFKKLFNIHSPSAMYHEILYRKESHCQTSYVIIKWKPLIK